MWWKSLDAVLCRKYVYICSCTQLSAFELVVLRKLASKHTPAKPCFLPVSTLDKQNSLCFASEHQFPVCSRTVASVKIIQSRHTHPVLVALLRTLGLRITVARIKYLQDSLSQSLQAKAIFHTCCIFLHTLRCSKFICCLINANCTLFFFNITGFDTFLMLIFDMNYVRNTECRCIHFFYVHTVQMLSGGTVCLMWLEAYDRSSRGDNPWDGTAVTAVEARLLFTLSSAALPAQLRSDSMYPHAGLFFFCTLHCLDWTPDI